MSFFHGINTEETTSSVVAAATVESGIPFVVGTAPVHTTGGEVNSAVRIFSLSEAKSKLGYSDDWGKYTLCEVMNTHLELYKVAPVVFVNVLDPEKHKKEVSASDFAVTDKQVKLPFEAIEKTLIVKSGENALEKGVDFDTFYDDTNLIVELRESGLAKSAEKLNIAYSEVDPSKVTKQDIIGGIDTENKKKSGLELISTVFAKFGILCDLLICPGFSADVDVATVMNAKANYLKSIFKLKAIADIDTHTVKHYSDAGKYKNDNGLTGKDIILCYPLVKKDEKIYHLSSHAAAIMASVDAENGGCPCESPSNKKLLIDAMVDSDGNEVLLDITEAGSLNSEGIVTAINFVGGFKLWGNITACFPMSAEPQEYFINISRVFTWVANTFVLTFWNKVDGNITRRLVDSVVDSANIWLNGLSAEEKIYGGRIEVREDENPLTQLMAGKLVFRVFLASPAPAQEMSFIFEYDSSYVSTVLSEGE